jgi:hypothetical protein
MEAFLPPVRSIPWANADPMLSRLPPGDMDLFRIELLSSFIDVAPFESACHGSKGPGFAGIPR